MTRLTVPDSGRRVVVVAVVLWGSVVLPSTTASACSIAPLSPNVSVEVVRPGDQVTISAPFWYTIDGDLGPDCSGLVEPATVAAVWVQDGTSVVLDDEIPVDEHGFRATVRIPTTAHPGSGQIQIEPDQFGDGRMSLTVEPNGRSAEPVPATPTFTG